MHLALTELAALCLAGDGAFGSSSRGCFGPSNLGPHLSGVTVWGAFGMIGIRGIPTRWSGSGGPIFLGLQVFGLRALGVLWQPPSARTRGIRIGGPSVWWVECLGSSVLAFTCGAAQSRWGSCRRCRRSGCSGTGAADLVTGYVGWCQSWGPRSWMSGSAQSGWRSSSAVWSQTSDVGSAVVWMYALCSLSVLGPVLRYRGLGGMGCLACGTHRPSRVTGPHGAGD